MARSTKTPSRSPPSSQDRGHFAQIPLSLLKDTRPEVTVYVRLMYAAIHSYCTFGTTAGAHPSTEQLAARMGCSARQVNYAREALRALGYASWKTGNKRHSQGNLYTLYPAGDGPGEASESAPPALNRVGADRGKSAPPALNQEAAGAGESAPPALKPVHHLHSDQCTSCTPQRAINREPDTERYRGRTALCSHSDTAFCSHCLAATVPSRDHVNADDEDF